jgi:hypothetical protein
MPKQTLDRLAKLREQMKKIETAGGPGFWSPKDGTNTQIRILPEIGDMSFFYQQVGRHHFPPDGKKAVYCPYFTYEEDPDHPCPVCEMVDKLRSSGDIAAKQFAEDLKLRRTFWMNIIVRGKTSHGEKIEDDTGPFIYTPGIKVMGYITALINNPEYGMIMDLNDGVDIYVSREGTGFKTDYNVTPGRYSSPLSEDQAEADKWLEKAKDLSAVELTDDPEEDRAIQEGHAVWVLPYNRIIDEFKIDPDMSAEDLGSVIDADEADEEPKRPASNRTAVRPKPSARQEVVEDEPEPEEPPAKAAIASRRLARRTR